MYTDDDIIYPISRLASSLYRLSQRYYDRELEEVGISGGQQFFLLHIADHEGISILDLAGTEHFDKGTTARAIRKLETLKYVVREKDKYDKRISRLFITSHGREAIQKLYEVRKKWNRILTEHLTESDAGEVERIMKILIDNAWNYLEGPGTTLHK